MPLNTRIYHGHPGVIRNPRPLPASVVWANPNERTRGPRQPRALATLWILSRRSSLGRSFPHRATGWSEVSDRKFSYDLKTRIINIELAVITHFISYSFHFLFPFEGLVLRCCCAIFGWTAYLAEHPKITLRAIVRHSSICSAAFSGLTWINPSVPLAKDWNRKSIFDIWRHLV